ncbi:P-loop NTPase fold protein [Jiulongibacter sediminis]|jgi:hypothetical protein|uniref:KAP family P-loop NTPase fold protein n=1 Tax=Jiulongibacter sediminis TaxID=1605367 RepID=UPI0026ECA22A|nr:P-loop NTPase fold protein [Jiulongibacter sediminis]
MKKTLRNVELEINKEEPFIDCKLGREKYAINLTRIIENYPGGFVLALNNRWGDGKTFFVNRWRQYLQNENFQTIYFNAWKDDFSNNPLLAIIAELTENIDQPDTKLLDSFISAGTSIFTSSIPIVLKSIIKNYVGEEGVEEIVGSIGEEIGNPFKKLVKNYEEQKKTVRKFKETLSAFAEDSGKGKPVVFFIDELDRCKPSYAVEALEIIKHLFDVENIVFILSIDKDQFSNSINGYYGSDRINGKEYLKRFIDLEYNLPEPELTAFIEKQVDRLEISNFFSQRLNVDHFRRDFQEFKEYGNYLFASTNSPLRTVEKILTQTKVALYTFGPKTYLFPSALLFLTYLYKEDRESFLSLKNGRVSSKQLLKIHNDIFKVDSGDSSNKANVIKWVEVDLMYLLHNKEGFESINSIISKGDHNFNVKFQDFSINSIELFRNIQNNNYGPRQDQIDIDHLVERIEFTKNIILN